LGGPDNYDVDIATLAKQTGQRQPTPVRVPKRGDTSESEGDDEGDGKPKSRKKVRLVNSMACRVHA
jgi:hypothetical protein